ncbi:MAG: BrnT family toxin [Oscillospiraceae bacterium]|nr:BrnT family toxin [Oscillospiraceae bacterium]
MRIKNQINIKKHGISFQEAKSVFEDVNLLYEVDDEHSYNRPPRKPHSGYFGKISAILR